MSRTLLTTVRLWHFNVPVYLDPALDEEEDAGSADYVPHPEVSLSPTLRADLRPMVLLHELVHIIDWLFGLDLSESQTRSLEVCLTGLLRENPILTRSLLDGECRYGSAPAELAAEPDDAAQPETEQ